VDISINGAVFTTLYGGIIAYGEVALEVVSASYGEIGNLPEGAIG